MMINTALISCNTSVQWGGEMTLKPEYIKVLHNISLMCPSYLHLAHPHTAAHIIMLVRCLDYYLFKIVTVQPHFDITYIGRNTCINHPIEI